MLAYCAMPYNCKSNWSQLKFTADTPKLALAGEIWGIVVIHSGARLIIKTPSYQYSDFHYKDKMVVKASYLCNKNNYTPKAGFCIHDDVIKWKHFPRYWPFVRGIHRSPVNSPHKGQWRGALMFSLICTGINGWVNNREAGDLRRLCAHHDIIVMLSLAGNSWGTDPDGTSCLGCGDQEQFYGCSDVAITKDGASNEGTAPPPTSGTTTTTKPPTQTTTKPPTQTTTKPSGDNSGGSQGNCVATGNYSGDESMDKWCQNNCAMGYCPATHCTCGGTDKDGQPRMDCMAVGSWIGQASMDKWCKVNCPAGNCPKSHCLCADSLYDKLIKLATLYKSGEPEIMHEKKGVATQYQGQFEQ